MMSSKKVGRDRTKVADSARFVHVWLSKQTSELRDLLKALSEGGAFYTASCHCLAALGAVKHRPRRVPEGSTTAVVISQRDGSSTGTAVDGVGIDDFIRMACTRLCDD